jgi:hypothetical protein
MDYRLRVSPWARALSLRVGVEGRLEVIAPRRYSRRTIANILARERAWIERALADAEVRRRALPPPPAWRVPEEVALPALDARWPVVLRPTTARGARVATTGTGELEISGQVADPAACRRALRRWLVREGYAHLAPRLAQVSRAVELPYLGCVVRLARSRWGNCSRTRVIGLNARLLLLPLPLVEYVLVHELCHTRELNHSSAFWALVARYCPEYQRRRADLRAAGRRLPGWVLDAEEYRA